MTINVARLSSWVLGSLGSLAPLGPWLAPVSSLQLSMAFSMISLSSPFWNDSAQRTRHRGTPMRSQAAASRITFWSSEQSIEDNP